MLHCTCIVHCEYNVIHVVTILIALHYMYVIVSPYYRFDTRVYVHVTVMIRYLHCIYKNDQCQFE